MAGELVKDVDKLFFVQLCNFYYIRQILSSSYLDFDSAVIGISLELDGNSY